MVWARNARRRTSSTGWLRAEALRRRMAPRRAGDQRSTPCDVGENSLASELTALDVGPLPSLRRRVESEVWPRQYSGPREVISHASASVDQTDVLGRCPGRDRDHDCRLL